MLNKIIYKIKESLKYYLGNIEWVWSKYKIPFTRNISLLDNYEYKNPFLKMGSSSSYELIEFLIVFLERIKSPEPFSLIRMGDSEMYFLQGKMHGNIIERSFLNDNISDYDLAYWKEKTLENDFIMVYDNPSMLKLMPFKIDRNEEKFKYDLYIIYQLIATKLLFFALGKYKVGIIGASEKIELIRELMGREKYQKYIGMNSFVEYIGVSQKGASTDYKKTMNLIESQMKEEVDIYLVGMSVAKLVILPELRDKYKKTFLDIGVGIDAIAGVIPNTKPYFGNWNNYRIRNYNYSKINFFTYQDGVKRKIDNLIYIN